MKAKFLIPLLLSSSLYAQDEAIEVLSQLQSINSTEAQDCSKMSEDELSLQCAHAVCGKPDKISVTVTASNAHKYLSSANQEKLKNLDVKLKDYYNKLNNDKKHYIEELEKRASSPSFLDVSTWKEEDFQNFLPFFVAEMSLQIDFQAPVNQRTVQSNTPDSHPYANVHKEIAKNFSIADHPFLAHQLAIINVTELRPVLSTRLDKIQRTLKEQNKTVSFNFNELQFGINSGSKNDNQVIELFMKLETELKAKGVVTSKPLCLDQCKKAIPQILRNFKMANFKKEFLERNALNVDDQVALCKSSFINANIENSRFDEFQKIWPEVKAGYLKNVFPQYSEHSRGLLTDYLEKGINFLPSKPENKEFPDLNNALKFSSTPYQKDSTATLVAKAITPSYFSSEDPTFNCPIIPTKPMLWDLFASKEYLDNNPGFRPAGSRPGIDNILISPFSCEHTGMGKGIIAHEIGHAITHVMSRPGMSKSSQKKFIDLRDCATDQWKSQPAAPLKYFKSDKLYTEEDTADLLSYMAVNDQQSFYGCGLLYPTETGYNELALKPHLNDNHSSGMVRLVRELQYKAPSKLPATCLEIHKRNKDKFRKTCF